MSQAKRAQETHDLLASAAFIQLAAGCAWLRHTGSFCSTEAAEMLSDIAKQAVPVIQTRCHRPASPRKVLHVLTHAFEVGGHTRFVWNWIEKDASSQHFIAVTQQGAAPIPPRLIKVAEGSGGWARFLDERGDLLRIAYELRKCAVGMDFIVLHLAPDDVVPILAFSTELDLPPIVNVNHADHVFGVNTYLGDLNLNIRESGLRLALSRRGIPLNRNAILPIPLSVPNDMNSRTDARRQLGIDVNDVVLLSVATPYKFLPTGDIDFVKKHIPILNRNARVKLIVVGPSPDQPYWNDWAVRTDGRVMAAGLHSNADVFRAAADIYCDSFPLGSLTSLLEAAAVGLPCVSWMPRDRRSPGAFLSCDDIALDRHPVSYADTSEYLGRLQWLIDSPDRARFGETLRESVAECHVGDGWLGMLTAAYAKGAELSLRRPQASIEIDSDVQAYDVELARLQEDQGDFEESMPHGFPLSMRLRYLAGRRADFSEFVKASLPIRVIRKLKTWRGRLKRSYH